MTKSWHHSELQAKMKNQQTVIQKVINPGEENESWELTLCNQWRSGKSDKYEKINVEKARTKTGFLHKNITTWNVIIQLFVCVYIHMYLHITSMKYKVQNFRTGVCNFPRTASDT